MTKLKMMVLAAVGAAMAGSLVTTASAETPFQAVHPRRAEVLHRLKVENRQIRAERRAGAIGPVKAAVLHHEVRRIRREERMDARFNHGRITKAEQHRLNRKENALKRAIGA